MERIFTYLAAILSRVLFSFHIGLTVWWLTLVLQDDSVWYIIGIYACCISLETAVTVLYRKGHEYYWFCPSIFIYTIFGIPCFIMLRMKLGECWRMGPQRNDESIRCATNVSRPHIEEQIENFGLKSLLADDEKIISVLDQTFLLLLVIGRWLLPKGQMSRDQLSQLLFIYIAAAADIVELTEIYDIRDVLSNESMTNLVIAVWSVSLLQFSVTIQNSETIAQVRDIEEQKLEKLKEKDRNGDIVEIVTERKSNRVAPALYTYKLAHRKAVERQRERRSTLDLYALRVGDRSHDGNTNERDANSPDPKKPSRTKAVTTTVLGALKKFEDKVQGFIHARIDLIQLLTPMVFQDGPFLILRLFVASRHSVVESNMFFFLIAKNAIVVMLQVYRICVLYCTKTDTDEPEQDLFLEREAARLQNVQTARPSIRTATLTLHAASKFKEKGSRKRKKSRSFSLALSNPLAALKKRRQSSTGQNSKHENNDGESEAS